MQIYFKKNGKRIGPFTEEQTLSMISAGMISYDDLAWKEGSPDWEPLHKVLGVSQPQSPPVPTVSAPLVQTLTASSDGPTGIGGWLLFFCVGLTILGPLFSLSALSSAWDQAAPVFGRFPVLRSVLIWGNLGSVAILIYGFIVGCMIWSGSPRGRNIARRFLKLRLLGVIGIQVIAFLIMRDLPSGMVAAGVRGMVLALFVEGVYFAIWWFYFNVSKRVRNTYGDQPTEKCIA